ncbi:hypothetical protein DOJK_02343 [Patescibacteria group bacterium]|nr:DUF4215 domain-containing protein [Candidatus Dojkabacteria bacterium]CAG1023438.1 hypothetical protein DOJK_02343 [Patescibacteria group bacterium]
MNYKIIGISILSLLLLAFSLNLNLSETNVPNSGHLFAQDAFCGDGFVQPELGEQCDDGCLEDNIRQDGTCNNIEGDGCNANCKLEFCGDGVRQIPTSPFATAEQCDDGNTTDGDGCSSVCVLETCGDGQLQAQLGEQCDDGNTNGSDGCSAQCKLEGCGDGAVQFAFGEQCDDGNTVDNDGCSSFCQRETCGDGTLQPSLGEQCDDGNTDNNDTCSNSCQVISGSGTTSSGACGNFILDQGEQCDEGPSNGKLCTFPNGGTCSYCEKDCEIVTISAATLLSCGNSRIDTGEQCDDGNKNSGDGCSSICRIERSSNSGSGNIFTDAFTPIDRSQPSYTVPIVVISLIVLVTLSLIIFTIVRTKPKQKGPF